MYDPTTPGLSESRLDKMVAILQSHLDDLETSLARHTHNSQLYPIATTQVVKGDVERIWEWKPETGATDALRIFVFAGSARDMGMDFASRFAYIGGYAQKHNDLHTTIQILIHPSWNVVRGDAQVQASNRETTLSQLSDWLRAVFNDPKYGHQRIVLDSTQYHDDDGFHDAITGQITAVHTGAMMRSFGQQEAMAGVEATHVAQIE